MDRDNNSDNPEQDFLDDARYDDAGAPQIREEEYAAGQDEWQEQPLDDFVEENPQGHDGVHDDLQTHAGTPPRRDPFADEGPLEDDFVQQHAEEQDGDGAAQPSAAAATMPPAGTKPALPFMKYLPYAGGGLAVLLLAFFGFQQFSGSFAEQPSTPPVPDSSWDTSAANAPHDQHAQHAQHQADTTQMPPPVQEAHANNPAPMDAQNTPLPSPSAPAPNVITPVNPAPPQPSAAVAALESRITELTQQIETMKQTQDQLNQKLQTAAATPPSMDESSKAANQALTERIAQLEEKLNAKSAPVSTTALPSASDTVDAPSKSAKASKASRARMKEEKAKEGSSAAEAPADEAASEKPHKKASTDFMAKRKAKKRRHKQDDEDMGGGGDMPMVGWVLRSAQPGSAWLSQGPYSSDLRRVTPGDKVQGLGTIISIRQVAGRWVVEGTQGAVR